MLICLQKINFISNFCLRYCTGIINLLFWELWKCLTISIKIIVSICSKFSCLLASKKSTSSFIFFLRYYREIANVLFLVIWAYLCVYLQVENQFHTHAFLEILHRHANLIWVLWAFLVIHNQNYSISM